MVQRPFPAVAQAEDAPAPTLVLDLRAPTSAVADRTRLVDLTDRARRLTMARNSELGAKTMALLDVADDVVDLLFVQGLPDGSIDPAISVCVNSAACALTVARHHWNVVPHGPLNVVMGGRYFRFEEVAG